MKDDKQSAPKPSDRDEKKATNEEKKKKEDPSDPSSWPEDRGAADPPEGNTVLSDI